MCAVGIADLESRPELWHLFDQQTPSYEFQRFVSSMMDGMGRSWSDTAAGGGGVNYGHLLAGIAYGAMQGAVPLGFLAPSPAPHLKDFEAGRGGGMAIYGLVEMVAGVMMGLSGTEIGGLGIVAAPFSSGASLIAVPAGAAVAVVGAATATAGAVNVGVGLHTVHMAMQNGGASASDDPRSASDTGGAVKGTRQQNRIPDRGEPGTVRTNPSGTTSKKYGPDGWVQKEFNKGHTGNPSKTPKVEQKDHIHDYKPNPHHPDGRPTRMPGREPRNQDLYELELGRVR